MLELLGPTDYTIAWLCSSRAHALQAAKQFHNNHLGFETARFSPEDLFFGEVDSYNVVIAFSDTLEVLAQALKVTFTAIRYLLVVGVGAAVPGRGNTQLGDIVVSGFTMRSISSAPAKIDDTDAHPLMPAKINPSAFYSPSSTLLGAATTLRHMYDAFKEHSAYQPLLPELFPLPTKPRLPRQFILPHGEPVHRDDGQRSLDNEQSISTTDNRPALLFGLIRSNLESLNETSELIDARSEAEVTCLKDKSAEFETTLRWLEVRVLSDYSSQYKSDGWESYASELAARYVRSLLTILPNFEDIERYEAQAKLQFSGGDYRRAAQLFEKVVTLKEDLFREETSLILESKGYLALAYLLNGQTSRAISELAQVATSSRKLHGRWHYLVFSFELYYLTALTLDGQPRDLTNFKDMVEQSWIGVEIVEDEPPQPLYASQAETFDKREAYAIGLLENILRHCDDYVMVDFNPASRGFSVNEFTAAAAETLAGIYYRQMRFDLSKVLYNMSLDFKKELFGADHLETRTTSLMLDLVAFRRKETDAKDPVALFRNIEELNLGTSQKVESDIRTAVFKTANDCLRDLIEFRVMSPKSHLSRFFSANLPTPRLPFSPDKMLVEPAEDQPKREPDKYDLSLDLSKSLKGAAAIFGKSELARGAEFQIEPPPKQSSSCKLEEESRPGQLLPSLMLVLQRIVDSSLRFLRRLQIEVDDDALGGDIQLQWQCSCGYKFVDRYPSSDVLEVLNWKHELTEYGFQSHVVASAEIVRSIQGQIVRGQAEAERMSSKSSGKAPSNPKKAKNIGKANNSERAGRNRRSSSSSSSINSSSSSSPSSSSSSPSLSDRSFQSEVGEGDSESARRWMLVCFASEEPNNTHADLGTFHEPLGGIEDDSALIGRLRENYWGDRHPLLRFMSWKQVKEVYYSRFILCRDDAREIHYGDLRRRWAPRESWPNEGHWRPCPKESPRTREFNRLVRWGNHLWKFHHENPWIVLINSTKVKLEDLVRNAAKRGETSLLFGAAKGLIRQVKSAYFTQKFPRGSQDAQGSQDDIHDVETGRPPEPSSIPTQRPAKKKLLLNKIPQRFKRELEPDTETNHAPQGWGICLVESHEPPTAVFVLVSIILFAGPLGAFILCFRLARQNGIGTFGSVFGGALGVDMLFMAYFNVLTTRREHRKK